MCPPLGDHQAGTLIGQAMEGRALCPPLGDHQAATLIGQAMEGRALCPPLGDHQGRPYISFFDKRNCASLWVMVKSSPFGWGENPAASPFAEFAIRLRASP